MAQVSAKCKQRKALISAFERIQESLAATAAASMARDY